MTEKSNPSRAFAEYVIEQLSGFDGIFVKRFFSGSAINVGELQLGFVSSDETLYLRLGPDDRAELAALGGEPFSYGRKTGKTTSTPGYFSVPSEIIDDRDSINDWCHRAYSFTRENYKPKKSRVSPPLVN
jgi:TfoX/Sxy family transcriptional regulator of competence genes